MVKRILFKNFKDNKIVWFLVLLVRDIGKIFDDIYIDVIKCVKEYE